MKKLFWGILTSLSAWQAATGQYAAFMPGGPHDNGDGASFTKTITYNLRGYMEPVYNLDDKTVEEKMFFGLSNSPVEYTMYALPSFKSGGLRLFKESPYDSDWTLEVIPVANYWIQTDAIEKDITEIRIPYEYLAWLKDGKRRTLYDFEAMNVAWRDFTLRTREKLEELKEENRRSTLAAEHEETYTSRRPAVKSFIVGRLGDLLHEKTAALITNFKAGSKPLSWTDGYSATFRCVVGPELWTLRVHMPENRAGQLSEVFLQILNDAAEDDGSSFDESKYISALEQIKF